jgi:hypothetical protein
MVKYLKVAWPTFQSVHGQYTPSTCGHYAAEVTELEEKLIHNTRKIYKSDFTPNSKQYYNMLFEKIEIKFL